MPLNVYSKKKVHINVLHLHQYDLLYIEVIYHNHNFVDHIIKFFV